MHTQQAAYDILAQHGPRDLAGYDGGMYAHISPLGVVYVVGEGRGAELVSVTPTGARSVQPYDEADIMLPDPGSTATPEEYGAMLVLAAGPAAPYEAEGIADQVDRYRALYASSMLAYEG